MGNTNTLPFTLVNETPYTWYFCTGGRDNAVRMLPGYSSGRYQYAVRPLHPLVPIGKLSFRYGGHGDCVLRCPGGRLWYILRESANRQHFELIDWRSGDVVDRCPNFGRLEEERHENERQERERRESQENEGPSDVIERYELEDVAAGRVTAQRRAAIRENWLNQIRTENVSANDLMIIETHNLGLVGKKSQNPPSPVATYPVEADHIPPKRFFRRAHEMLQNGTVEQNLLAERPELVALINEVHGNGNRGFTRVVLKKHHSQVLTTGNTTEGDRISVMMVKAAIKGDMVKLIKLALIAANPEMSERLRRDAGIKQRGTPTDILSEAGVKWYHNVGDRLIVDRYREEGILRKEEHQGVMEWLNNGTLYTESEEYEEIYKALN